MVLTKIEQLLEKYDNAETTLQEEQELRDYFSQDTIAPHLESYKVMFQYFKHTKQEHYTKDVPLKPKKTNRLYQWISVAAVAVLMLGIFIPKLGGESDPFAKYTPEEQELYHQTKEALAMLSSNFNEGASSLSALNLASENFNRGAEQLTYVGEFSKQTNKLLKNK